MAFEKFLRSSFCEYHKKTYYQHKLTLRLAQEDCASWSLVKGEVPDEDKGLDDSKEGNHKEGGNGKSLYKDNEQAGQDGTEGKNASVPKPSGPSEYIKNKFKNMEELKRRLDKVNTLYPNEVQPEKKAKKTLRKSGSREEPIVRWESLRIKDKRQVHTICHISHNLKR